MQLHDTNQVPDGLIPDKQVRALFGNVSSMALWRWTKCDGFPPKVKILGRNYRSRKAVEEYRDRKIREAMKRATAPPAPVPAQLVKARAPTRAARRNHLSTKR